MIRTADLAQVDRERPVPGVQPVGGEGVGGACGSTQPVLRNVQVEPRPVAFDEVGDVPRRGQGLARPVAYGEADAVGRGDADRPAVGPDQTRPAYVTAQPVLLRYDVRGLKAGDRLPAPDRTTPELHAVVRSRTARRPRTVRGRTDRGGLRHRPSRRREAPATHRGGTEWRRPEKGGKAGDVDPDVIRGPAEDRDLPGAARVVPEEWPYLPGGSSSGTM